MPTTDQPQNIFSEPGLMEPGQAGETRQPAASGPDARQAGERAGEEAGPAGSVPTDLPSPGPGFSGAPRTAPDSPAPVPLAPEAPAATGPAQPPDVPSTTLLQPLRLPPPAPEDDPARGDHLAGHSTRALQLVRESHQTLQHELGELVKESQAVAAAHGQSLRQLAAATGKTQQQTENIVRELLDHHLNFATVLDQLQAQVKEIKARLNTQANAGQ